MEDTNQLVIDVLVDDISVKKSEQYLKEFNQALDKTADKSELLALNLANVKKKFKEFSKLMLNEEWRSSPMNVESFQNLQEIQKQLTEMKKTVKQISSLGVEEIPTSLKSKFVQTPEGDYLSYYTETVKSNGDKIRKYYSNIEEANGKLVGSLLKVQTQEKKLDRHYLKGDITSEDLVKHRKITTAYEEQDGVLKKIVRTYDKVRTVYGHLSGILTSEKVTLVPKEEEKKPSIIQDILKGKAVKKLKDFWGSMKRIFRYRALRAIIQGVTNTLRNGFSTISQQSDEVRASTDKLKGAWTAVSVSLASTLVPVVESLSSMLEPLANYMINYANSMSLANAEAQGQAQYFKLDKDAIDEYAKSLQNANKQLTALDKFATLSGTKNKSIGYYTGITDEEKENTQKALEETKKSSFGLGEVIFNIIASIKDLIQWFSNLGTKGQQSVLFVAEALLSLISPVFALLSGVKAIATLFSGEASASAKGFAVALLGVFAMIVGIKTLLGDYGSVGLAIGTILGVGGALSVVTGGLVGSFGSTSMGSVAQTVPSANYNIPVQSGTTGNGSVPNYIVVNMDIDGQKFASATAQPMAQALNNRNF